MLFKNRLFSVFFGVILTITVMFGWAEPELMAAEAATNTQQELEQINQAIDQIEQWLRTAKDDRPAYESRLAETEEQINLTSQNVESTRSAIAQTQLERNALNQQAEVLEQARLEQVELLGQSIRAAYMEGGQSYLKLLLSQEDPTKTARMLQYYQRFNLLRVEQITHYQTTLDELAVIEQKLLATNLSLQQEEQTLANQLSGLDQIRATRQLALAELGAAVTQQSSELEKLRDDREALEQLIEQINQAVENIPQPAEQVPFAQLKGNLPWPGAGELISTFGSRIGAGDLLRQGITIASTAGSPVQAVHGGRVVFADWLRGRGLLVVVDHGEGFMSLYGHNETISTSKGNWVNAGDIIATAGDSGGQQQTGIYFEIRQHGRPQDPADWCLPRT